MIEVKDLNFSYPGARSQALSGLSFDVQGGEIFGFLGPSGAGKSTTQKILFGLLRGYSGEVRVLDEIPGKDRAGFYSRIGVAFEFPNFYSKLTGEENLEYYAALYSGPTEKPRELLARVGLAEHARKKVGEYSKGMKMRLNFCRAMIHRPQVLFLDEPTSGLDPSWARVLKDWVLELRSAGKTVFLTTHSMETADELCDRVAFLNEGSVSLCGNPSELKVSYGKRQVKAEWAENGISKSEVFPMEGLGDNDAFLDVLRKPDLSRLHSQEATLEDIFLAVTGRGLQ